MPLDILYEVSPGIVSVTDDGIIEEAFAVCRYSLLSVRWIYYGCHGPTKPFVTFLPTSPRGEYGWPLSVISLQLNSHLRVLRI